MFQFTIKKEDLLAHLLTVSGAVDKKQSLAILSHFLLKLSQGMLFITATDLEIEITAQVPCESEQNEAATTVPAKKFIDSIKSLDDNTSPSMTCDKGALTIKQGQSSFKLTTLPAQQYPNSEDECNELELTIPRLILLQLLQSTHFALSQQDVRIFLNGLFLDFEPNSITAVGTDGHRMAIFRYACTHNNNNKLLLPKKGVQELIRILQCIQDENVLIAAGKSHFKLTSSQFEFKSKLIEARFPPYAKAIPKNQDKQVIIEASILKRALTRMLVLAHEKSKAVMLHLQEGQITFIANNNEQEEAMETLLVETEGDSLKIGLNAGYLLDVLNYMGEEKIRLSMSNTDSSILVESLQNESYQYIIMPMKL